MKNKKKLAVIVVCFFMFITNQLYATDIIETNQDLKWPNPGAINVQKKAIPTSNNGIWKIELKVEGKNKKVIEPTDVILVLDRSGSMNDTVGSYKCGTEEHRHNTFCYEWYSNEISGYDFLWGESSNSKWTGSNKLRCKKQEHIHTNSCMRGTRANLVQDAATKFISGLTELENINLGLVTFSTTVEARYCLEPTKDKDRLMRVINGALNEPKGGTNMQQAILQAKKYLDDRASKNGVIILLSDGEPTYYTRSQECSGKCIHGENQSHYYSVSDFLGYEHTYICHGYCQHGGNRAHTISLLTGQGDRMDNGTMQATLNASKIAKDAGYQIYSIGAGSSVTLEGEEVLKRCSSNNYYFRAEDSTSALNNVLGTIARCIRNAATQARIIDPMGEKFSLVLNKKESFKYSVVPEIKEESLKLGEVNCIVSQGTVNYRKNARGKDELDWEIGNIGEGTPAIMQYYVALTDVTAEMKKTYYTNGLTVLNYEDVYNEKATKLGKPREEIGDFDIPKVGINTANIRIIYYLVNKEGYPINEYGQIVERPDLAYKIKNQLYIPREKETSELDFGTYKVECEKSYKMLDKVYNFKEDILPIGYDTVAINAQNLQPTLYFPYVEGGIEKIVLDSAIGSSIAASKNFICPEHISEIEFNLAFQMPSENATNIDLKAEIDLNRLEEEKEPSLLIETLEKPMVILENKGSRQIINDSSVEIKKGKINFDLKNIEASSTEKYTIKVYFKSYFERDYRYSDYLNVLEKISDSNITIKVQDKEEEIAPQTTIIQAKYVPLPKIS